MQYTKVYKLIQIIRTFQFQPLSLSSWPHMLKSLKVAKSKDDDGGVVNGSVDAGDVNGVLMLCVMV